MVLGRALRCVGAVGIVMGLTAIMSPLARAETVVVDIAGSYTGTQRPASVLDGSGITFVANPTSRSYIASFVAWLIVDGTNIGSGSGIAELTINVPQGQSVTMGISGGQGTCNTGVSVVLRSMGSTVQTDTFGDVCSLPATYSSAVEFDQMVITVGSGGQMFISSLSFDVASPSPTSGPPVSPMQGVSLPASGDCGDVDDRQLTWGAAVSGGWAKSWQSWAVSDDPTVARWEGWACVRTLVWSSGGWTAAR